MEPPHIEHGIEHLGTSVMFGPFQLLPAQQLLLEADRTVAVGGRAFQILVALVERAGEVVSKEALAKRAWPDTFVEESNLRVHIAGLRRALRDGQAGSRYIINVPGRGYSFVAPVHAQEAPGTSPPPMARPERPSSLPPVLTRIIGRAGVVDALCTLLSQRRFVTLVGPGGIGKTTVAVAVARQLAPSYRDGISFVDFTSISGAQLVASALSGVLGLAVTADDALPAVVAFLQKRQMLLVLDSCEHVIEAAATAAEEIASSAPGIHILATSLEPLRAAGERVHRLPPLENPAASAGLTAAQALAFPGVQLFVERAAASLDGFVLTDADAPLVADICRRLDGIALAIELAAGRVAAFGIRELAARLDDRFRLLTNGRRTALPRHQTLAATLDWSYELLTEPGRKLLRRLAVFAGDFTLAAAAAMAERPGELQVLDEIAELVSKSLILADASAGPVRYRLLDTTRLYGLDRMRRGNELQLARRVHAEYLLDLFARADAEGETLPPSAWMATYGSQLDNVRLALDWAESEEGSAEIYVALTIRAVTLWVQLSLMSECRARVERALARLEGGGAEEKHARMQLSAALGWSMMYAAGRSSEIGTAWARTLDLAEELGDTSYRLRGLWGVWVGQVNKGEFATALRLARQLVRLVRDSNDALDRMMADRLLATTLHYRGEQKQALGYIERMLSEYARFGRQPRVARFQVDQKVTAHYFQARMLWLLGHFDQARRKVEANVEEGQALGHALSFGSVLGQGACPIALSTGDLAGARRFAAMLLEHSERYRLRLWHDWACCFEGLVTVREGEVDAGLRLMRPALDKAGDNRFLPRYMILLGELGSCLGQAGQVALGLETVDGIITRCERSQERWYLPEALRIKGELTLLYGARTAPAIAEALFVQAAELARRQHARALELRSAISVARLRRDANARSQLAAVVSSFAEGFGTSDLLAAEALLSA